MILKWTECSVLVFGIKINTRGVNSVSSHESLSMSGDEEDGRVGLGQWGRRVSSFPSASGLPAGKISTLFINIQRAVCIYSSRWKVTLLKTAICTSRFCFFFSPLASAMTPLLAKSHFLPSALPPSFHKVLHTQCALYCVERLHGGGTCHVSVTPVWRTHFLFEYGVSFQLMDNSLLNISCKTQNSTGSNWAWVVWGCWVSAHTTLDTAMTNAKRLRAHPCVSALFNRIAGPWNHSNRAEAPCGT